VATQAERRTATRGAIRTAARHLFAERGFAGTSIDDVAVAAGVKKGGVYHHFESKERLFEEVFRWLEDDLYDELLAALPEEGSGVDRLVAGTRTFLKCCVDRHVRQIVLVDGPNVLGWELWRQIDSEHFLPLVVAGLAADAPAGTDVTLLGHLLIGAMDEAVMLLAAEDDPADAIVGIGDGLEAVLRAVAASVAEPRH